MIRHTTVLGFVVLACVSITPLLLEPPPVRYLPEYAHTGILMKALTVFLLGLPIGACIWAELRRERRLALGGVFGIVFVAGAMTLLHEYIVDQQHRDISVAGQPRRVYPALLWQRYVYLATFNMRADLPNMVPHIYRPLPCGFVRTLERLTGDWRFSCVSYRAFFNFWFVWAFYRFVRLFHATGRALIALGVLLILYPMSIWYYLGQLTDAMSHALFAFALIYLLEDDWPAFAVAVVLGVLAKETAVVLVPAFCALTWRSWGWGRWWGWITALSLGCIVAFMAARLPTGWRPGSGALHSFPGLMLLSNLGIGQHTPPVPAYHNYLQPLLFIGVFLPFIAWQWHRTDPRLKALFLTLVPLIALSSLLFSWLFESRNYVPLLPILSAMSLGSTRKDF